MPTRVAVDDDEQIIADLQKDIHRLRSRLATTSVRGSHDEFTAAATPATTYQLSTIPVTGTCLMALNGHVQREGTDYTCDYTTGIVTVTATQAASDKLTFRYLITDWLVARSLPADTGVISDDFNRTNATSLGSTSIGSLPWTAMSGTWGTDGTRAKVMTYNGLYFANTAYIDVGQVDGLVEVDIIGDDNSSPTGVMVRLSGTGSGTGYSVVRDATASGVNGLYRHTPGYVNKASFAVAVGDRVGIKSNGAVIEGYVNGVLQGTFTDGVPLNTAATWVGLIGGKVSGQSIFDNFAYTPL